MFEAVQVPTERRVHLHPKVWCFVDAGWSLEPNQLVPQVDGQENEWCREAAEVS